MKLYLFLQGNGWFSGMFEFLPTHVMIASSRLVPGVDKELQRTVEYNEIGLEGGAVMSRDRDVKVAIGNATFYCDDSFGLSLLVSVVLLFVSNTYSVTCCII